MPPQIAALPRDERGYPIPFFAPYVQGKPVFALSSSNKRRVCASLRLCWICGQPLFTLIAFVGGPMAAKNRTFADAGMHVECAQYAAQVCPYMVDPSYTRRIDKIGQAITGHDDRRPDETIIYITNDYRTGRFKDSHESDFVFIPDPAVEIQRWKDGKRLDEAADHP